MNLNIYDIQNWTASTNYIVNDIVSYQGIYYYARTNHTSGLNFDSSLWNGPQLDNGENKPYFFFRPSYNSNALEEPRVKRIVFGDGYEQNIPDGINTDLLVLDFSFELRTTQETVAICHFLYTRKATESFLFMPPPPFGKLKRFRCRQWSEAYVFKDNHTVKVRLEETPV